MFKSLGLILKSILKVLAECTQHVLDSLESLIRARKLKFPPKVMEAFIEELGESLAVFASLFGREGAVVPCYPWKPVLLTWHPKDVPTLLSRNHPYPESQVMECMSSWYLQKVTLSPKVWICMKVSTFNFKT